MSQLGDAFTATSNNTSKKFRIDQDCQKVLIVRGCYNGAGGALNGHLLTGLPERLSLEIQGTGSHRVSQGERIPLGKMAAWAQFGEGVVPENTDTNGSAVQYIPVLLASIGVGLNPGDNSYLLLENCVPGVMYEVYAMQTPTVGTLIYDYQETSVLAGDKHRKVDVSAVIGVVIPNQGLNKLVVTFLGGRQCEYLPLELSFMNAELNDIETLTNFQDLNTGRVTSIVSGSFKSEAIVLKLDKIAQLEFYTDGNLYEYITVGEIDRNAA